MEQKQMMIFLTLGIVLGAVFVYGMTITGFITVNTNTAQGRSLVVKAENTAAGIARTFEKEGYTGISVVNFYEVKTVRTGTEKMVVYPIVLRDGDFDIALQERALSMFEAAFGQEVLAESVIVETDLLKGRMMLLTSSQKGGATPCGGAIFMGAGDNIIKEGNLIGGAIQSRAIQETFQEMKDIGYIDQNSKLLILTGDLIDTNGFSEGVNVKMLSIVGPDGDYDSISTKTMESMLRNNFGAFDRTLFVKAYDAYSLTSPLAVYRACSEVDVVEAKQALISANSEVMGYYGLGIGTMVNGDPGPIGIK